MTESPISAEVDNVLSSCDNLNNDLSDSYESSDSYVSVNSQSPDMVQTVAEDDCACYIVSVSVSSAVRHEHCSTGTECDVCENHACTGDIALEDTLLKTDNVDVLALDKFNNDKYIVNEVLMASGYISQVQEVYFGMLSDKDTKMLLKYAVYDNTLVLADMANWYNRTVKHDTLDMMVNQEINYEEFLDTDTLTKAVLKYNSQSDEWWIYKLSDSEDEQSHIINETDSHDLDYAYDKHDGTDMHNLIVLTTFGAVFIDEQISEGSWDNVNDTLDAISSETLLPDHQEMWTQLFLLAGKDSTDPIEDSHSDDNEKKNEVTDEEKTDDGDDKSDSGKKQPYEQVKHTVNRSYPHYYAAAKAAPDIKLESSATNSTDSGNATVKAEKKGIESPKTDVGDEGPTYTLVYAIIGIVLVSILFNSSYMKRDD